MVVGWIGWLLGGLDDCKVDWMFVGWIGWLLGGLYGC